MAEALHQRFFFFFCDDAPKIIERVHQRRGYDVDIFSTAIFAYHYDVNGRSLDLFAEPFLSMKTFDSDARPVLSIEALLSRGRA